jgi:chromosome partitioning protein
MTAIVFGNPKGGSGKSTSAIILATQFAEDGHSVTMIDADPNRPIAEWSRRPGRPSNLNVLDSVTEDTIISAIEDAQKASEFVIVDLEGTASVMVAYATSRANLFIIPSQGSHLDGKQAARAVRLVRKQEEAFRMKIPTAVLFTRTSAAIPTRDLKSIEAPLNEQGVPVYQVRIIERAAYRALFAYGGTLSTLDQSKVSGVPAALANAKAFADETIAMLERK